MYESSCYSWQEVKHNIQELTKQLLPEILDRASIWIPCMYVTYTVLLHVVLSNPTQSNCTFSEVYPIIPHCSNCTYTQSNYTLSKVYPTHLITHCPKCTITLHIAQSVPTLSNHTLSKVYPSCRHFIQSGEFLFSCTEIILKRKWR